MNEFDEHLADPNVDTLDEEALIQGCLGKMQTLWTESRSKSLRSVEYAYVDEQDHWDKVMFSIEDNSTPTPKFNVETPDGGSYKILASRAEIHNKAAWYEPSVAMTTGIYKREADSHIYAEASAKDKKDLAKYLQQLDVDTVRLGYEASLAHRRKAKAPKVGTTAIKALKNFFN